MFVDGAEVVALPIHPSSDRLGRRRFYRDTSTLLAKRMVCVCDGIMQLQINMNEFEAL